VAAEVVAVSPAVMVAAVRDRDEVEVEDREITTITEAATVATVTGGVTKIPRTTPATTAIAAMAHQRRPLPPNQW
jgi:hypothetical protein